MRSKKAIYNIVCNLLLQFVIVVYGFVVPKIIIDYFGSEVNGLIASITQFLAYITLLESGFGPVVRATLYKPIAKKDEIAIAGIIRTSEKFFRRIALIFLLYIVVLCFVFPLITRTDFDAAFTVSLVVIIGISTFAEYFFGMAYRLFLQAEQKTYVISIIQTITYLLSIVAVVVLAVMGADILIIKLISGLIFVLRPLMQNFYVKKKYKIKLDGASEKYPIKQKWDGLAQHIAAVIHGNTDVTVLTLFTSLAEVSVYAVYYLVVSGVKKIVQAFTVGIDASFGDMIAKKEDENLRRKFSAYELLYIMVITVIFACTFVLITPFIVVYTEGVTDADYIRPLFGYLLVASEFIWAIRAPYASITLAAGHFRETRRGAWIEAIINIVVSIALVWKFGLVGVTIGTIVAMLVRAIEFIYHANKYVLKRNIFASAGKIVTSVVAVIITAGIVNLINLAEPTGYMAWIKNAVIVLTIAGVITLVCFGAVYYKDLIAVPKKMKTILRKKKK